MLMEIYEVFEALDKTPDRASKIELMRKYYSKTLEYILVGAFDKGIEWMLPAGDPPYKSDDSPPGLSQNNLHKAVRTFYMYCRQGLKMVGPTFKQSQRETKFIQMLETIPAGDARIALQMIRKNLTIGGLTVDIVQEAFPGMLKHPIDPPVVEQPDQPEKDIGDDKIADVDLEITSEIVINTDNAKEKSPESKNKAVAQKKIANKTPKAAAKKKE